MKTLAQNISAYMKNSLPGQLHQKNSIKDSRQKRHRRIFFFLFLLCCIFITNGKKTYAASGYQKIFPDEYYIGDIVKSGKYYFKYTDGNVYISSSKNGTFIKTPLNYSSYSNGRQAYYVNSSGKALCQYTFKTHKAKKLKKLLSSNKAIFAQISAVYGKNIYLTCGGEAYWRYDTYIYNTAQNKVVKKIKNCHIVRSNAHYAVSEPSYHLDVSGSPIILYQFTSAGLKEIKTLSEYGLTYGFVGNKLYYTDYPVKNGDFFDMSKAKLYRCNMNGTGTQKMATLKSKSKYDQVLIQKVTSTYCTYWCNTGTYKYTYKTKKTKKISS